LSREVAALQSRLADAAAAAAQSTAALAEASRMAEARAVHEASLSDEVAALQAALNELRHAQVVEHRAAQASSEAIAAVRDDGNARVAAAEARLAATVDAANGELTRVRTEAQAVHAQASEAVAEVQGRLQAIEVERQALQDERKRLLAHVTELEAAASAGHGHAESNGHATEVAELTRRVEELQGQMAQADPAVMATVRSLVEAVDPLRWGLGSAIDYLHPFEGNDQSLASHVRNLRLLQATLARLVAESGRGAASG
jgi:DNA repair exonuclease SbcCD ATPase subunit